MLKILHIPTAQSDIVATILEPESAKPSLLALAYAIYFAAVTSLDHKQAAAVCQGAPLDSLSQYKSILYQIFLEGDLFERPNLASLQALAIFLVSPFLSFCRLEALLRYNRRE